MGFFVGLHTLSYSSSHSFVEDSGENRISPVAYIMTGFLHPKSLIIISQRCNALWSLFLQSYHGVVSKCVSLGVHILRDGDN